MDINKARNYALRLLEMRGRSVREIKDKLKAKTVAQQDIDLLIDDLRSLGLLDDEKFSRDWIENRRRLKPMGPARIRAELIKKGISREIIDPALNEFVNDTDQEALALPLAEKKIRSWRGLEREKIISRMTGFLGRRGFSAQIINNVLKKILKVYADLE